MAHKTPDQAAVSTKGLTLKKSGFQRVFAKPLSLTLFRTELIE